MLPQTVRLKFTLFALLTVALAVLVVISAATAYFFNMQHELSTRYYSLKVLSQEITYYDEVLTMSTLVGAYSGEKRWLERYENHAEKLDDALAKASATDPEVARFVRQTIRANQQLIEMEQQAFMLAQSDRKQEAVALIASDEYREYKQRFIDGMRSAVDRVLMETEVNLSETQRQRGSYLLVALAASFVVVIGLCIYLIRYIKATDDIIGNLVRADELSGLLNRRVFNETLEHELKRSGREGSMLMLAILDLDNFKKYNDNYGHPKGDKVISQFGRVLLQHSRRSNEAAFRIGGEEFALIATCKEAEEGIQQIVSIVEHLCELKIPHNANTPFDIATVSVGIAFSSAQTSYSPSALYQHADEALYEAKAKGKNRYVVAT